MSRPNVAAALLLGTILSSVPARAADAPVAGEAESSDREVVVVGERLDRAEASSGTKSDVPLVETPQSISVITATDIAGLGLQNLNQALRFVAGVTPEQRGSSAELYDQFKLRGFDAPVFLDGLKLLGTSGYLAQQVDVSLLDRVEVVKGPASVLYGQTGPGGLVALSSKLPLAQDFYGAVAGTYGSYDLYRVDADVGGRAGPSLLWRLSGSVNGADTQQYFGKRERETVQGAVTAELGSRTRLTLLGRYSHDPYNGTYGVFPASGVFIDNPNGRLPTRFDGGEPGNRYRREQASATYILDHDFGGGWSFRSSARYTYGKSRLGIVYTGGSLNTADPTQQTFNRASYSTRENANAWTYDEQLHGHLATGPFEHSLLIGADRQVGHAQEVYAFGSAPALNGYHPVYGQFPVPTTPEDVPDPFAGSLAPRVRQQGVYAQDDILVGGFHLLLSGRQDWARVADAAAGSSEKSDKFTWRAGALYKTEFGLAPYVSYSTSFEPQSGTVSNPDGTTGQAKPSEGKQIEAGAKYQVPNTSVLVTAAWFQIDQTNLLTAIPNTPFSTLSGKVRSRGVEVEAAAPLSHGFNGRLAYSRQKVRTIRDENPANVGKGILGVGRGGVSANLEWAPEAGPLHGLAIGGAVRHVDRVYAGTYFVDGIERSTPSSTVYDALVRYDLGQLSSRLRNLTLSVNAMNILDKKYITTCYLDYGWCWYGNRRTVEGTIGYHW